MAVETTGNMPTEYDPTTDRVLRTLAKFGTPDEAIQEDQSFLVELMTVISRDIADEDDDGFITVMDCAFVGLVYHRHMPFLNKDGELFDPKRGTGAEYSLTLTALANVVIDGTDATKESLKALFMVPALRALAWMRRDDPTLKPLQAQFLALSSLGHLIHTYIDFLSESGDKEYRRADE